VEWLKDVAQLAQTHPLTPSLSRQDTAGQGGRTKALPCDGVFPWEGRGGMGP